MTEDLETLLPELQKLAKDVRAPATGPASASDDFERFAARAESVGGFVGAPDAAALPMAERAA